MNRLPIRLFLWLTMATLAVSLNANAQSDLSLTFNSEHAVDASLPDIAAPVDFNGILIDESTVELSWNPALLDGSSVNFYNLWDRDELLVSTRENRVQVGEIDRNKTYDFSVSAVLYSDTETRRSSRVYYDLPQLDSSLPDENNHYLPPLENLEAEVVDADSVRLTWEPARSFWSWADPSEYSYAITVGGHQIDVVDQPEFTLTGVAEQGLVWVGVSAFVDGQLYSRQPNLVLVDTDQAAGTISNGYAAFNSLFGLRTEVYSSTAAELFWEASQFPNVSHVYVNGRLIARMMFGDSLFIEGLPPGERVLVSVGEGWPENEEPPFDWALLHDYPLMHAWLQMPAGNVVNDGTASPVTGLRADVYSSSAAEVFWDNSDVPLARFRVYLDGQFLQETYAVSLFLDELAVGSTHTVGVSMVEQGDAETEVMEVVFSTRDERSSVPEACLIKGLRATVYSATAAEVFWNRGPVGQRYNIMLNGEFVIISDAVSWFREGLMTDGTNRFSIRVDDDICQDEEFEVVF